MMVLPDRSETIVALGAGQVGQVEVNVKLERGPGGDGRRVLGRELGEERVGLEFLGGTGR